jgi:hypothetical protein
MSKKVTTQTAAQQKPDLADLLAAVIAHPDLPQSLCDSITDALCELNDSTKIYESPLMLRALFDLGKREKGRA